MRLHRNIIRERVRFGFFLTAVLFAAVACRYGYIQVFKHSYYLQEAHKVRVRTKLDLAQRGSIIDCNGVPLAMNVKVGDVNIDPFVISDPTAFASAIAPYLPGITADEIQAKIVDAKARRTLAGRQIRYVPLIKGVDINLLASLDKAYIAQKAANARHKKTPIILAGYSYVPRWIRTYPKGSLASQVVGFVGNQGGRIRGSYGIEKSMDTILCGHDGYSTWETDAKGNEISGTESAHEDKVDGGDIQLTIDVNVQRFAEEALAKSVKTYHGQSGICVVMDPKNGNILAMANEPTYDPNHLIGTNYNEWDNRCVSDLYEPGSTLKTITLSAVLDSLGLDYQYHHIHCSGQVVIGGHVIHCAPDPPDYGVHGEETMRDVLKNSCNIGAALFAMQLGPDRLFSYEKAYGFLEKPDIGLPEVQRSRLKSPIVKKWSKIQLANIAFGQGISITPLQLTSAYSTIANGGKRVYPHIIKGEVDQDVSYQVIKPEVAKTMLSMLQTVVEDGTGKPAQVAGYNIGGKTGSAQVPEHGHYGGAYVGSFCGVAPLSNPKLVILCAIFKPSGVHWGAVVAAPVVHDVAQQTLWYMQEVRDAPDKLDYVDQRKVDEKSKEKAAIDKKRD